MVPSIGVMDTTGDPVNTGRRVIIHLDLDAFYAQVSVATSYMFSQIYAPM